MTEWLKTFLYVGVAAATVGLAFAAEWMTSPVVSQEFEQVGDEFYPEFDNPLAARSMEVASYDPDSSSIYTFNVNWDENGWSISPYGYPADAEDTLEKTAASVVGITRAGLASRRKGDHERFGVIDPLSKDDSQLQGRGKRIALKDENDQILMDLIIGQPAEGREGYYYVRMPKEDDTYIAKVDLELSTRFADWIESDLLKISASDLKKIEIKDYSLDEDRGRMELRGESVLVKGEDFGPWTLDGLNESTEQLNTAAVNGLTRVLDELKIIGVRPKPAGLNADLSFDPKVVNNQLALELLQRNLNDKGFFFTQGSQGSLALVGKEGQLIAMTTDGIAFDLYFGEQFSGSRYEIEFGESEKGEAPTKLTEGQDKDKESKTDSQEKTDEQEKQDSDAPETGRYVFIAARFVPDAAGQPPEPPAPAAEDATEQEKKAAEQAQQEYETAKKAHEAQVADAKQRVEDLNSRFEDWYYVLSTENFEDLRLSRAALVEPKEAETNEVPGESPATGLPVPGTAATEAQTAGEPNAIQPVAAPKPTSTPAE